MYISTREMVISIICNACGVLGLILWAIEAHKSNANQRIQSVESVKSVENNGDIIVRSNLEPFRVADTPQTEKQRKVQEAEHRMANIIADMTPQTESTGREPNERVDC